MTDHRNVPLCSDCQQQPGLYGVQRGQGTLVFCEACLRSQPEVKNLSSQEFDALIAAVDQRGSSASGQARLVNDGLLGSLIADAVHLANDNHDDSVDGRHLIGAMLRNPESRRILVERGLNHEPQQVVAWYHQRVLQIDGPTERGWPKSSSFDSDLLSAATEAQRRARADGGEFTTLDYMLDALLDQKERDAGRLLRNLGVEYSPRAVAEQQERESQGLDEYRYQGDTPALDQFGTDLTAKAYTGNVDPVIGRDKEIKRMISILARRNKNNPVLIGEAGVGKTAVVEGLAQRIIDGDVPEMLQGVRIVSLNLSSLLAGGRMAGDFEERINELIDEVRDSEGGIVLFIDEVHMIMGAGSHGRGSMDVANILKPAMSRGEIRTIGASTLVEYKEVEKDKALARRFQPITVDAPDAETTLLVLQGLAERYSDHHRVLYPLETLQAAVAMSDRYIPAFQQPDKSIDLIDEAGAIVGLRENEPDEVLRDLYQQLDQQENLKNQAVSREEYEEAARLKSEVDKIHEMIGNRPVTGVRAPVTVEDLAAVIHSKTGIPVGDLVQGERAKLAGMEQILHRRVVGQQDAVREVAKAVRRSRLGLGRRNGKRPMGSFLFLGPTGVGKTELAKALAEAVMGDENAIVRIDGSEYAEKHNASRLVSSPPGYVGYGQGGQLTEPVRRRPYSVVLIDEVEKMHPEVWNYLLQIMGDARLTDGSGETTDFQNTIVILTSNVGAAKTQRGALGFAAHGDDSGNSSAASIDRERVLAAAKQTFPPELLNRLDGQLVFDALGEEQARLISAKFCKDLAASLAELQIELTFGEDLIHQLARDGFSEEYGARPLARQLRTSVEDVIVDAYYAGEIPEDEPSSIVAVIDADGKLQLTLQGEEPRLLGAPQPVLIDKKP